MSFVPGPGSILSEGLTLGLATGSFCLVSCLPLLVPLALAEGQKGHWAHYRLVGEFLLGRLIAYIVFGSLMGFLGQRFLKDIPSWIVPGAMILSGVLLLGSVLSGHFRDFGLCRFLSPRLFARPAPFLLGFVVGINICPPFAAGMVRVFQLGSPISGGLFFLTFFLGTSLYLLPIMIASPLPQIKRLQSIGVLASILAGLWFIGQGILMCIS